MCGLALRCSSVAISCEFVSLALQCDTARRATRCIPEHRQGVRARRARCTTAVTVLEQVAPTSAGGRSEMALTVFRPLLARLTSPRASPFACDSVILNSSNDDGFRHVELTPDTVRLEFDSPRHPIYQRCLENADHPGSMVRKVRLATYSPPRWLIRIRAAPQVENKMSFGAGATVVLDRSRFTQRLLQKDEAAAHPVLADGRDIFDVDDS